MAFEQILGNDPAKVYLRRALQTKSVPNTLLFAGPDGVGKSQFAQDLALELMYSTNKAKKEKSQYPDLHIYYPEGKMQMHAIGTIRNLIHEVHIAPFEAEAKVFIIHEAERMLPTSANALLKILEEPNLDSYLVLLSSKCDEFLPTITSRCSRLNFSFVAEEEISQLLQKRLEKKPEEARQIAKQAQGSVAKALDMATHPAYHEIREALFGILSKKGVENYYDLSQSIQELEKLCNQPLKSKELDENESIEKWRKQTDLLFSHILMWYRDLHLINSGCDKALLFFSDHLAEIEAKSLKGLPSLETVHRALEEVRLGFDRNMKLSVCLEQLFFKLDLI